MRICSHIHTYHSHDSNTKVKDIVDRAIQLGYDAIAITDHNTTKGAYEALGIAQDRIEVIIGAEFNTEKGHILCFNIDNEVEENCKREGNQYDFYDLVREVRKQNGLLFLAHPIQSKATAELEFIEQLDGIELINSRVESSFAVKKSKELNRKILRNCNTSVISGCDAHTIRELESTYMGFDIPNSPKEEIDSNQLFLGDKTIYFKKTPYKVIAWNKLTQNKTDGLEHYAKQIIKLILGIFIDMIMAMGGNEFETIRICKEDKQRDKAKEEGCGR